MKTIEKVVYVADDGAEYRTAGEALHADLSYLYSKYPLEHTDGDGYGHTVPVEDVIEWLQGDPEVVDKLAHWLLVKKD